MKKDTITIKIKSNSGECEQLREDGVFFTTIANTLNLKREDIKEVKKQEKHA
jgi:hypothetical protein